MRIIPVSLNYYYCCYIVIIIITFKLLIEYVQIAYMLILNPRIMNGGIQECCLFQDYPGIRLKELSEPERRKTPVVLADSRKAQLHHSWTHLVTTVASFRRKSVEPCFRPTHTADGRLSGMQTGYVRKTFMWCVSLVTQNLVKPVTSCELWMFERTWVRAELLKHDLATMIMGPLPACLHAEVYWCNVTSDSFHTLESCFFSISKHHVVLRPTLSVTRCAVGQRTWVRDFFFPYDLCFWKLF
jgi:hypothetical protein